MYQGKILSIIVLILVNFCGIAQESSATFPDSVRDITLNNKYLLIPIKNGAPMRKVLMNIENEEFRNIEVELATSDMDFYAWIDVSEYAGDTMRVTTENNPDAKKGITLIKNDSLLPESFYKEQHRLQVHYSPKVGWVNDPNGLFYYKGDWHLFYQHNPYGQKWGNMSWGHAISKDLIYWKELPVALHSKKDMPGYAYSGSAIVDWKNNSGLGINGQPPLLLFFAATHTANGHEQWLAYSNDDGRTWKLYDKNPIVPNLGMNDRDPKVIWDDTHKEYIMVLYQDNPAKFIYLASQNLLNWTRKSDISFNNMNECPDFFPMEVQGEKGLKKWVMMSGHGKFFEGDNWNYLLGSWDGKKFTPETAQLGLEQGVGNYSTQTWSDAPNQRRIFSGWFTRSFESFGLPGMPANGQFRIPWEFKLKRFPNGLRLTALPVKEFNKLRGKVKTWNNLIVQEGDNPTKEIQDSLLDIEVKFKIGTAKSFGFNIMGQQISYDPIAQTLTCFEYKEKPKTVSLKYKNKILELRIIVDNGALEIFSPDGSFVMTGLFTKKEAPYVLETFSKRGTVEITRMDIYSLKSIWK